MTTRYFANHAPQQMLAGAITNSATSCTISGSFAGWPTSYPFYAELDRGTASAEIVLVTNISGLVATITRGQDGDAAVSHPAGATLDFVVVAQDLREANTHINASSGVHGISGHVIGDSDVQTLSNKTLTAPVIDGSVTSTDGVLNVTGDVTATGNVHATDLDATGNANITGNAVITGTCSVGGKSVIGNLGITQAYTPVLTATTTNPTLGNSTLSGIYCQIGNLVFFEIALTVGSTFSVGSGTYEFSLPVAAGVTNILPIGDGQATGSGRSFQAQLFNSASVCRLIQTSDGATALSNTGPYGTAWASGNILRITGYYFTTAV